MPCRPTSVLSTMLICLASSGAIAQSAPPSYQADPSVYKVIFENESFRVIAATWKPGTTDKSHSHPLPSVGYSLTDCTLKLTNPDGKTIDRVLKSGTAMDVPITASHTGTNVGPADCQTLFVERK
jgi:hypothetical protein